MNRPPANEHELELAIVRRAGRSNPRALADRITMANAIVGQFLGDGVAVKGGSSLRFRYGSDGTRHTMDFDTTRRISLDEFLSRFQNGLSMGWEGFTGEAALLPQASPRGVPPEYVMQPIRVKLFYKGKNWCSVDLEISLGEAGAADDIELMQPNAETVAVFTELGFPAPMPAPLMRIEHQVAQKLHAVSDTHSHRAHDLIDLQLIVQREKLDFAKIRRICVRLFAARKRTPWPPPKVKGGDDWPTLYDNQKGALPVLPTVEEAVDWVNGLIEEIDSAKDSSPPKP
ncbi:MAG: nucleotidyl transferase AbiEii/AbiGii toxin family protein [Kiritimatiellae bacterium]|nr:nucleotidyl transferase AbiEii/AbiGii toxin family protein [Kiritimatiellia bacterium]